LLGKDRPDRFHRPARAMAWQPGQRVKVERSRDVRMKANCRERAKSEVIPH
jgi:hypothetical protein